MTGSLAISISQSADENSGLATIARIIDALARDADIVVIQFDSDVPSPERLSHQSNSPSAEKRIENDAPGA